MALFTEAAIPWDDLTFTVIEETLRHYFAERSRGRFDFYMGDIASDKGTGAKRINGQKRSVS